MVRPPMKMTGLSLSITERAKLTLDRQARERGITSSMWAGQIFDMGFAAVCAREKSMPISDGDLDALVGGTLLLMTKREWDVAEMAQILGVPEETIACILEGWQIYRRGQP
jgi:hypothetical protein